MTVSPLHQQSLEATIGRERALQACLPTCFYMLAKAHGYVGDEPFEVFTKNLDWNQAFDVRSGWLRAKLSQQLRRRYHMGVVSWWPNGKAFDRAPMTGSGYVTSQREWAWFDRNVEGWPLEVIVAAGTPVIVTMRPGFGENKFVHAVILAALTDDRYEIIDPDARNHRRFYPIEDVRRNLSPVGAASVVLPKMP